MSIEFETLAPTLTFSDFAFSFETPDELREAINAGHKPKITRILNRFKSVDDYGATLTVEAGDVVVDIELNAPSYLWFVILEEFCIEDASGVRAVDYNEGILALIDNETYPE
jgi:hypothetical protein